MQVKARRLLALGHCYIDTQAARSIDVYTDT